MDPAGPGTWIAASSAGLAFVLLNGPQRGDDAGARTRGGIIPWLAGASSRAQVAAHLRRLRDLGTRPFTLLVVDDDGVLEAVSDGSRVIATASHTTARLMRTSSSVDADRVCAWRRHTFAQRVPVPDVAAQDAFHAADDEAVPARGVLMARPDACTVSITSIDMSGSHLRLAYRATSGDAAAVVVDLARTSPGP